MTLFLKASSLYSFLQVPKTFHCRNALQECFCNSSCNQRQTQWWWDQISVWSTGCCQTLWAYKNLM